MSKDFKLEALKVKYQIVKDKVLLFSAGFSGSVMILLKMDFNSKLATIAGLLKNLYLANKLYNDIERVENE